MKKLTFISSIVIGSILLSACGIVSAFPGQAAVIARSAITAAQPVAQTNPVAQATALPPVVTSQDSGLLAAYEGTLENVYTAVNPSVVNIRVLMSASAADTGSSPQIPGFPTQPQNPQTPQFGEALGSGFVWDSQGHIVTNNHVVENAQKVEVTFADGTVAPATVVGTDVYSDLAVIKVDVPAAELHPVQMADSTQAKVGELTIAIGNPFGLAGTMTTGIISALGRSYPVDNASSTGPNYIIPDVIQTDASINPGNSGGVLVNDQGQVLGVTFAIESNTRQSSGVGFVIPAAIVQRVVPSLIQNGSYEHSYIGISGANLVPELATAMGLSANQHGALVEDVTANGPAEKAGLRASAKQVTINGQQTTVGGDVITAIDGQAIKSMDDLIAYLADSTSVGQKVTLTVLRDGKETSVEVTLGARPKQTAQAATIDLGQTPNQGQSPDQNQTPNQGQTPNQSAPTAWMGISGLPVTAEIAQAMSLAASQQGVLVEQVQPGSPAENGGLQAGSTPLTLNGQQIMVGGDVITAMNSQPITSMADLQSFMQSAQPGDQVTLTVLRNGKEITLMVTLGTRSTP